MTKTTPAQNASLEALKAQMAAQLVGHHVGVPASAEAYTKPTNYVFAKNGLFRVVKTPIALFITKERDLGATDLVVPGLNGTMEEGVELLVPKIPMKYWLQVYAWYKDVDTKDKTEASVLFFWNTNNVALPERYTQTQAQITAGTPGDEVKGLTQDGQLIIYCPRQENSGGLSKFGHDGMVNWLRENTTPLLETHSHNTMGAFFSSTDDANENANQFYAVYGKIQSEIPAFVFRFCSGKHKIQCDPSVLFDFPQVKVTTTETRELDLEGIDFQVPDEEVVTYERYEGPWPIVEYPEDWMGQHKKDVPRYSGYPKGPGKYSRYGSTGTPKNGLNGGAGAGRTGYQHHDAYDYYADAYGYGAYGDGGVGKQSETVKKNLNELGQNESPADVVEARSGSKVEVFAHTIANQFTTDEVKDLVTELCEFGYDFVIMDYVKEMSGAGIDDGHYDPYDQNPQGFQD